MKPTLDLALQQETIDHGITQSELSMLDQCAMKWNLRYNNLLNRADDFPWTLFVGSAWHAFQERIHTKGANHDPDLFDAPEIPKNVARDSKFEETLEYWSVILPAYQRNYLRLYGEETKHDWFIVEQELTSTFMDWEVRGMLDLASSKPRFIRDFKTTSSAWLTSPNGWHFKLQFMLYCWLMLKNYPEWGDKPFDFQLDMMQKPGLKHTKKETWSEHLQRVVTDIGDRPLYYMTRQTALISRGQINRFEETVLAPKIAKLTLALDPDNVAIITNMNTNSCNAFGHQCEFFEICEKGWDVGQFFFEKREVKHQEL